VTGTSGHWLATAGIKYSSIQIDIVRISVSPGKGERCASSSDHGAVFTLPTLSTSSTGADASLSYHHVALLRVQGCDGHAG
jgi:hypothetical protein